MQTVIRYLRPQAWKVVLQLIIKLSGTVVELFIPRILSVILDTYAATGDMNGVMRMGFVMLLCALLAWGGNSLANVMSTRISRDFAKKLRYDLFERVSYLSSAQRDRLTESSILSRLTSDTYNVHNMVDRMQRLGIRAPILLIGGIIVSFTLEPMLTLVLIACLPLLMIVIVWSSKKGVPLFTDVQREQDKLVRRVQENMGGQRIIRALDAATREIDTFEGVNQNLAARQKKADLTMAAVGPVTSLVLNLGLAGVVLVGAWRVSAGASQPGTIIAFLSYFTIILNALMMVSRMFVMYSKGAASAERIEQVMNLEEDLKQDEANTSKVTDAPHVEFRNVSFSNNHTIPNLQNISFALKDGETLGIIGPTGSGKTTLLSLLQRLYDADSGEILIHGKHIRSLSKEELREKIGVVFQNDFLMADTIRENIRFERDTSDAEIAEAVECAQADFIYEKEKQLEEMLSVKGRNLSGGQQQRVLIARALAWDPRLLMLDDCSSALDYRTDRELRRALKERHGTATTIIVAQRVSSVMGADQILVMDGGRIIGSGTHEALMISCDMYRELCSLQLGGESA